MKKLIIPCLVVAGLIATTGCTNGKVKSKDDPTKTNIHIYNYDGGVGTEWVRNAAARFEAKYAETSFEEGKTGVKVHVSASKAAITPLKSSIYNIFFTEGQPIFDYVTSNEILDITDIVKDETLEDVSDGKEKVTIESKLTSQQKEVYTSQNGKYYYLPHYETYSGISYDKDVFKEYALYIKDGGGYCNGTNKSLLSVGPNGIKGDYDDGLPSSIEEFLDLLDWMSTMEVIPYVYSGQYSSYLNSLVSGIWASIEGKDRFALNYEFDSEKSGSTVKNRTLSFDNSGNPIITEETITKQTGYKTQYQEGKYYGYKMIEDIVKNPSHRYSGITTVFSHIDAQTQYINSSLENTPIAFLVDGSYWYNEAKEALEKSVKTYGEAAKNRNFSIMPLPVQVEGQVKEGQGKKNTMISPLGARAFINANVNNNEAVKEVSKLFLKYVYTQDELENFTADTGLIKGVSCTISETTKSKLSNFAKNMLEIKEASDIIDPIASNTLFINNAANFSFANVSNIWKIKYNNTVYVEVYNCIKAGATAEQAFKGGITQQDWTDAYSRWF